MPIDRTRLRKASAIYADVLLQAAMAGEKALELSEQLQQVSAIVRGNVELRNTLADKSLPGADRANVLKELLADFDAALVAVLVVMTERDDIALLPRVCESYVELAEQALESVFIDVTTVVALDDGLRQLIKDKYSAQFGRAVLLREHVDSSLVGGIVLSARGRRVDASVLSQLDKARNTLARQS
jgi:F-type H+-transporting ATPase subunit delta